jgi:hypothetical protein
MVHVEKITKMSTFLVSWPHNIYVLEELLGNNKMASCREKG